MSYYVPSDEVIYGFIKTWMPPVPAIFKMAMKSAFVLIHQDAEHAKLDKRDRAKEHDANDPQ